MKTLILYATKHGAAAEIARRISEKIDGAAIHDLKQGGVPPISDFGCVIIGSSIYAGAIRKEAKAFMSKNAEALRGMKFGIFISCLETDKEKEFLDANFQADVLQAAKSASSLGGVFDPAKAGAFERFIIKLIKKGLKHINTIDDDKIAQFAEEMQSS